MTGSYARYVGQIQEVIAGVGATSAGSPGSYYCFWQGPSINATCGQPGGTCTSTAVALQQMFSTLGVTQTGMFPTAPADVVNLPGVNQQIVNPLKSPNVNEYVLGIGGTLGANCVYRIDAVRREFRDFYMVQLDTTTGFVSDALGNTYNLGIIINSNLPQRNYTGLHTSLAWRTGGLNLGANWTWSHTIGNFGGENSAGGAAAAGTLYYPEYHDDSWSNPKGSLFSDQRHRVRIYASHDWRVGPVGIQPGLVWSLDTGTPYGAWGNVNSAPYVPLGCSTPGIDQNHCYLTPPASVGYFFTARDAYRTDTIYRTDLSLNFSARAGPVEFFLQPQIQNLFNGHGTTFTNNPNALNMSVYVGRGTTPDARGLVRFNPFTTKPIECPQADTAPSARPLERTGSSTRCSASRPLAPPRSLLFKLPGPGFSP